MDQTHPMRSFVFFDAVGTIIYPAPDAAEVYYQFGKKHGCDQLELAQISRRFSAALQKHFGAVPARYDQPANDAEDKLKWQKIVSDVFEADYRPELFGELWSYFSKPGSWRVDPQAYDLIDELQSKQVPVAIASNFDSRLREISDSLFPMISPDLVFHSTQLGYAKPDVRFFKEIENRVAPHQGSIDAIMIGDNWSLDVEAAQRAGWRSIWKTGNGLPSVRQIESYFFRST